MLPDESTNEGSIPLSPTKMKKASVIWFIDKDTLIKVINKSLSLVEVLEHFGLLGSGGNYKTLQRRCLKDKIDLSKFKESGKIKKILSLNDFNKKKKIAIESILVLGSKYNRVRLKNRLLKEGILENKCIICGQLPEWNGKTLVLQIDHINGISNDNRLENLRILCPHCHSQTENFAGKNKGRNNKV